MIYEHSEYTSVLQSTASKREIERAVIEDIIRIVESLEDVTKGFTLAVTFDNDCTCRMVNCTVDVNEG